MVINEPAKQSPFMGFTFFRPVVKMNWILPGSSMAEQLFCSDRHNFADVAQWQSNCFVNSRSWVQIPPSALVRQNDGGKTSRLGFSSFPWLLLGQN